VEKEQRVSPDDVGISLRQTVIKTWTFRANAELEARQRFMRLFQQLQAIEAAPIVLELTQNAIQEEERHLAICKELVMHYGGKEENGWGEGEGAKEIAPNRLSLRERVLYELVAFCCITESLNASLMTAILDHAKAPIIRRAGREILKDEISHARIGWAFLAAERQSGRGAFLGAYLPAMLQGAINEEVFEQPFAKQWHPSFLEHGELPLPYRVRLFKTCLEEVVFPGLEAFGVDCSQGKSWLDSHEGICSLASQELAFLE